MASKSNIVNTKYIKLKIQGERKDILEFEERLSNVAKDIDCQIFDKTPPQRNRESKYFRKFVFLGMNRRKENGKEEKK